MMMMMMMMMMMSDCLQKGCEVLGLSDMAMPDQLYLYMVGGQKRPMVEFAHLQSVCWMKMLPLFLRPVD